MPAIKFRGVDFIQYDALLTDEERLVNSLRSKKFIKGLYIATSNLLTA